jgi:hypothetical protein
MSKPSTSKSAVASPSSDEMMAELERLRLENEELKKRSTSIGVYFRVSERGAISVFGLQRLPLTLFAEQWQRLLDKGDDLLEFIEEHKEDLSWRHK